MSHFAIELDENAVFIGLFCNLRNIRNNNMKMYKQLLFFIIYDIMGVDYIYSRVGVCPMRRGGFAAVEHAKCTNHGWKGKT